MDTKKPTNAVRNVGTVRLTLSAGVANDLGTLKQSLKSLAERLGHPSCATGCDILHLHLEREFIADAIGGRVSVHPVALPQDPVPLRTVHVSAPNGALDSVENLSTAIERVVGKLGCGQCCSGFDILFQRELGVLGLDKELNVHGFGRFG